jgi:hypothetical protein
MKILIILAVGGAILFLLYLWTQARSLHRFEQEMLPLLAKLLKNPRLQPEHQRFLRVLRERDDCLRQIKSKIPNFGFTYKPTQTIRDRLLDHTAQHPDDPWGHERFMATFQKTEYLSDEALFNPLFRQCVRQQTPLAQERIELCLEKAIALPYDLIPALQSYLFNSPTTFGVTRSFYSGVTKLFRLLPEQRQQLYNMTLELLRKNPRSVAARQLALDLGRWHFGKTHPNGSPTLLDDDRVHHDIQVATAASEVAAKSPGQAQDRPRHD